MNITEITKVPGKSDEAVLTVYSVSGVAPKDIPKPSAAFLDFISSGPGVGFINRFTVPAFESRVKQIYGEPTA